MRLLSISSQVVAGHVGNAALAHPLACQGATLLAVPTVLFSNHPGYGRFAGRALPGEEVAALLAGLEAGGFLAGLDGLLTGYLGRPETALAAAEAAARLRAGGCRYLLDPVLGDAGRLYVAEGIEAVVRDRLLPLAEAVTPNPFELERLTGQATGEAAQQLAAARLLLARGPRLVLVTSAAAPRAAKRSRQSLAPSSNCSLSIAAKIWPSTRLRWRAWCSRSASVLAA